MSRAIGWIDTNLPRVCGLAAGLMILGIGLTFFNVGLPNTWLLGPAGFVLVAFGFAVRTSRRRVALLPGALIAATALLTGVLSALPRDRISPLWGLSSVAAMAALMLSNRRLF